MNLGGGCGARHALERSRNPELVLRECRGRRTGSRYGCAHAAVQRYRCDPDFEFFFALSRSDDRHAEQRDRNYRRLHPTCSFMI